jgi:hypothetical protein
MLSPAPQAHIGHYFFNEHHRGRLTSDHYFFNEYHCGRLTSGHYFFNEHHCGRHTSAIIFSMDIIAVLDRVSPRCTGEKRRPALECGDLSPLCSLPMMQSGDLSPLCPLSMMQSGDKSPHSTGCRLPYIHSQLDLMGCGSPQCTPAQSGEATEGLP